MKATGLSKESFYNLIDKLYDEVNRDSIANEMPDDSLDYVFRDMWTPKESDSFREGGGKPFTVERGVDVEYPGTEEEFFNEYLESIKDVPENEVNMRNTGYNGEVNRDDYHRAQEYMKWRNAKRRNK